MSGAPMLLVAALAAGLVVQAALPTPATAPVRVPVHRVRTPDIAVPAPIGVFSAILAHPLFNAARSADVGVSETTAAPVGAFMLLGVATARGSAVAIVRDAAGELRTLRPGDVVDGWRLATVGHNGVALTEGSLTQTLGVGAAPVVAAPVAPTVSR